MSRAFYLRWESPQGQRFVTAYGYDGLGIQQNYTAVGWIHKCIRYGKRNGYRYHGMATGDEYVRQNWGEELKCRNCEGTGRVVESEDSVLKTTCMWCLGSGKR